MKQNKPSTSTRRICLERKKERKTDRKIQRRIRRVRISPTRKALARLTTLRINYSSPRTCVVAVNRRTASRNRKAFARRTTLRINCSSPRTQVFAANRRTASRLRRRRRRRFSWRKEINSSILCVYLKFRTSAALAQGAVTLHNVASLAQFSARCIWIAKASRTTQLV